ncbi:Cys/Met metabolism, pyridoxal phosphate-dependent enzyme, partial [mine drainage metagenome]
MARVLLAMPEALRHFRAATAIMHSATPCCAGGRGSSGASCGVRWASICARESRRGGAVSYNGLVITVRTVRMNTAMKLAIGTRAIHAGQAPDPSTGAIMTPIYATS